MTRKGSNHLPEVLISELMDASTTFSLRDICDRCGIHADYVIDMVEFGIVEPEQGLNPRDWRFNCRTLLRVRKAVRLQNDLSLDLAGLAMSLELIDEVEDLRRQVAELQQQLRWLYRDA